MPLNYGKLFEMQFRKDASRIEDCFVLRLPDQLSGYYGASANISDFIVYKYPSMYLCELKSIQGNTFPFANLKLYPKLKDLHYTGLYRYVIIWYRDHDRIIAVDIDTVTLMMKDDKKSVNIKTIESDGYNFIEIPVVKKQVFLTGDYSSLFSEENNNGIS